MTITPAYGRDYKNKAEILVDWELGKDFLCHDFRSSGRYINKEDAEKAGLTSFQVRYKQSRSVAVLKKSQKGWRI